MKTMPLNKLYLMAAIHFVLMFLLMYSMVNVFGHVIPNLNQVYMAAIMTAPMVMLEIAMMGQMYENRSVQLMVLGVSSVVLVTFFLFIRQQVLIYDKELIRSMIPHHSGAILMCEQAQLSDPELQELCDEIVQAQEKEIAQMEGILERLSR